MGIGTLPEGEFTPGQKTYIRTVAEAAAYDVVQKVMGGTPHKEEDTGMAVVESVDPGRDVPDSFGAEEYQLRQGGRAAAQEQRLLLAQQLQAAHADHVRFTLLAQQLATLNTISRMNAVSASAEYSILPEDMSQGMQAAVQGALGTNVLRKAAAGDEAVEATKVAVAGLVVKALESLGLTSEAIAALAGDLVQKTRKPEPE